MSATNRVNHLVLQSQSFGPYRISHLIPIESIIWSTESVIQSLQIQLSGPTESVVRSLHSQYLVLQSQSSGTYRISHLVPTESVIWSYRGSHLVLQIQLYGPTESVVRSLQSVIWSYRVSRLVLQSQSSGSYKVSHLVPTESVV